MYCRLQETTEQIDRFERESSSLEQWMSGAVQNVDTVNGSLQTLPLDADQLAHAAKALLVCWFWSSVEFSCADVKLDCMNLIVWFLAGLSADWLQKPIWYHSHLTGTDVMILCCFCSRIALVLHSEWNLPQIKFMFRNRVCKHSFFSEFIW